MRRFLIAAATFAALVCAGSLAGGRAEAMSLPGVGALAGSGQSSVEQVALVCRNVWNGRRHVRSCVRTGPVYVAPRVHRPHYVKPRPYRGPHRAGPHHGHRY